MRVLRSRIAWLLLLALASAAGVGLWRARLAPAEAGTTSSRAAPAARNAVLTAPLPQAQGPLSIRGKVLGPDGPVAQAAVVATAGGEDLSKLPSGCPNASEDEDVLSGSCLQATRTLADLTEQHRGEAPAVARALSNPDGSFELTGLPEGTVTLWAESAGRGIALQPDVKAGTQDVELRLEPGQVLAGKVVGDTGEPLPGAAVTALTSGHRRYFDGQSGNDGRFLIGPVPEGEYTLVATAGGRLPARADATEPAPTLQLFTPRRIAGLVVRDGRGVPGARVEATTEDEEDRASTTSDGSGRFELTSLRPGVYEVSATATGDRGLEWVKLTPSADATGVEVALTEGAEISGEVVDSDGHPFAGAEVHAEGDEGAGEATTGPEGRFRIGPLAPGAYSLYADAKGYLGEGFPLVRLAPGDHHEEKLILRAGVSLKGLVVDPDGKPLAGATVEATADSSTGGGGAAQTRDDGTFEMDALEPADYEVRATHPRFKPASQNVKVPGPEVRLAVVRGGAAEVRVVDERNAPVTGADVYLRAGTLSELRIPIARAGRSALTTDGEGRALFEGLETGTYRVEIRTQGAVARHGTGTVDVREGATAEATVRLAAGKSIHGVVVDTAGAPLAGASVQATVRADMTAQRPPPYTLQDLAIAETGPDGRFDLEDLIGETYELNASKDGFTQVADLPPARAGAREPVKLVLRPVQMLRLRVLREDRRPLTAFEVDGVRVSAPDGEASLAAPETPEEHLISATGHAPARVTFDPEEARHGPIEVVLHTGRRVTGRVVNARNGQPVPDAEIQVRLANGDEGESTDRLDARSGPGGTFTLPHVEDGCFIAAEKAGYRAVTQALGPGEGTVTLALEPLATLKGKVFAEGLAPDEVRISVLGPGELSTNPEPDGTFEFTDLTEGEYTVTAWRSGDGIAALAERPRLTFAQVSLRGGETTRVELRLSVDAVKVRVRLVDPTPPRALLVFLMPGRFVPRHTGEELGSVMEGGLAPQSSDADLYDFDGIAPGHYTLVVAPEQTPEQLFTQELDVQRGGEQLVVVPLPPAAPSATNTGP